jgi:uncharacterized membrane protein
MYRVLLSLVFVTALLMGPVYAGTTGVLSGRITNPKGNGIANAHISLRSGAEAFSVTTNANGFYSILGVRQSTYVLAIDAAGYNGGVLRNVTVNADQTSTLNLRLSNYFDDYVSGSRRSTMTAFQPSATTDQYTLDAVRIRTQLGH